MEFFLMKCFYCIGATVCISLGIVFLMYIWEYILGKWLRSWEGSKYAYDIVMWYLLKRFKRREWRKNRRYFLKGNDRADFLEYQKNRDEYNKWKEYEEIVDGCLPSTSASEYMIVDYPEVLPPASTGTPMPPVKPPALDRVEALEAAIRKHRKDCPDDDFEPDHELWAMIDNE